MSKRNNPRRGGQFYSIRARVRKDESGDHGSQQQSGNNQGGNPPQGSGDSKGEDNTGPKFDPSSFWTGSADGDAPSSSSGESADKTTPPAGQPETPNVAQVITTAIQQMEIGSNIMSSDVMTQLQEGKPEAFHTAMNEFGRNAVAQSIQLMIPLIRQMRDEMQSEFEAKLNGSFASRDNAADLLKAIPSAADPKVRPIVDSIFNRAMQVAKGDRAAAIAMTKEMLKLQTETLSNDLGIPPRDADSENAVSNTKVDWLATLAGR